MRIGPEFQHGPDWGFLNQTSPNLIYLTSVGKLEYPEHPAQYFFYACDAMR